MSETTTTTSPDSTDMSISTMTNFDKEALDYHSKGKPGKIEITSSKPCSTEKALSLAYSPGVAAPCKVIAKDASKVYDYTSKGNLVAVISNGTAVLGLGNIGALASKPVMEGKGILFKQFAGIDVFDIEMQTNTTAELIAAIKALEPTFGGINLEDIKAPECFEIEETLKKEMKIPVFHDDQHGTAIVSGAALLNACYVTKRKLSDIRLVVNGAGASAIACSNIFISLGVKRENLIMCDTQGVIHKGRQGLNKYKAAFAVETEARTLSEALRGADVFVGLSAAGALTPEMLKDMTKNPIVFAMANPDPEIEPARAKAVRPDVIVATGRSDFPNQVNNVLGFPSIFRGALDTRSTQINEEMKLAAVHALAMLAREDVPDRVSDSYGGQSFKFGPEYLIPKPFDPRVLLKVAPAVAKAAMESGVAQKQITDWSAYRDRLEAIQGPSKVFIRSAMHKVRQAIAAQGGKLPKIIFPEGHSTKILKALRTIVEEGICEPVLLGYPERIKEKMKQLDLADSLKDIQVIHPSSHPSYKAYANELFTRRARKGVNYRESERLMADPNYFASMMVMMGDADGMVNGASQNYGESVKPILHTIGVSKESVPAGLNIVLLEDRFLLLADTTVNFNPTAEQCAIIALQAARISEYFGVEPRVAMLSYSNFSGDQGTPAKMKKAAEILSQMRPDIQVDGDIQADTAVNMEIMKRIAPFAHLKEGANILVFPNLEASNICYKLLQQIGKVEVIGPFLMGVRRSANVLQRSTTVDAIINSVVLTTLEAMFIKERLKTKNN